MSKADDFYRSVMEIDRLSKKLFPNILDREMFFIATKIEGERAQKLIRKSYEDCKKVEKKLREIEKIEKAKKGN